MPNLRARARSVMMIGVVRTGHRQSAGVSLVSGVAVETVSSQHEQEGTWACG